MTLKVISEGKVLNISWEEPYSHPKFPVLSYNLTMYNKSSSNSVLLLREDYAQSYLINKTNFSGICNLLKFTVTAKNEVGNSDEGVVTGGFPTCRFFVSAAETSCVVVVRPTITYYACAKNYCRGGAGRLVAMS